MEGGRGCYPFFQHPALSNIVCLMSKNERSPYPPAYFSQISTVYRFHLPSFAALLCPPSLMPHLPVCSSSSLFLTERECRVSLRAPPLQRGSDGLQPQPGSPLPHLCLTNASVWQRGEHSCCGEGCQGCAVLGMLWRGDEQAATYVCALKKDCF